MSSSKIITLQKWREMDNVEILQSIGVAARVLEHRSWTNQELKRLALTIMDLVQALYKVI